jgi:hypothetical protein
MSILIDFFGANFDLQRQLFEDRQDIVIHEIGLSCHNCRNNDPYASTIEIDGRPNIIKSLACEVCSGNGYIYRNAKAVQGLVTSVHNQNNKDITDLGYATPGDAVFSPNFEAGSIGEQDRITFTNPTSVDSQLIVRGAATMHENHELKTDLLMNEDRLWYLPESAVWCEDSNGVVYYQGSDFTFLNNKIVWTQGPENGTIYTIKYRNYPEWVVYSGIMERYDRARNLGQKVLLKKKHVHFQNGSQAASPEQRLEEQSVFNTVTKV